MSRLVEWIRKVGTLGVIEAFLLKVIRIPGVYQIFRMQNKIEARPVACFKTINVYIDGTEDRQRTVNSLKKQTFQSFTIIDKLTDAYSDHVLICSSGYEFHPCCLQELVLHQEAIIYFDEDVKHRDPLFKPDYNPYLLQCYNYIGNALYIDSSLIKEYDDFDAYVYEILLENKALHLPLVLGTRKSFSTYVHSNTLKVLQEHLPSSTITIENDLFVVEYPCLDEGVSILIPNKDHVEDLRSCIQSIMDLNHSTYEIIIIENNSKSPETFAYYDSLVEKFDFIHIYTYHGSFNYAKMNNMAVSTAKYDNLLFLHNDVKNLTPECLANMLSILQQENVGAVGCKLYYPDHRIQHAGVIVGLYGVAENAFKKCKNKDDYMKRAVARQNYLAVSGACMMTRKSVFEEVFGFRETYQVIYNDIDYCLKLHQKGYYIVFDAYTKMIHYEAKSRELLLKENKSSRLKNESLIFRENWMHIILQGDPFYSKNLSSLRVDFAPKIRKGNI